MYSGDVFSLLFSLLVHFFEKKATSIIVVSSSAYRGPIALYCYVEVISSNRLATAVFYLKQRL
ncbi:hypothetical protein LSP03_15310 [Lysinibacillus sphaericus]|nr:hypothetical protein LSP03_15310 [Lysinibacillus sphaericus]